MKSSLHPANFSAFAKFHDETFEYDRLFKAAHDIGYHGVEIGGGVDKLGTPEALKEKLAGLGLEVHGYSGNVTVITHQQSTEKYKQQAQEAREYGAKVLAVCGGFLPNNRRNTYEEDYDGFAENLKLSVAIAEDAGVPFAFHPHRGCIVETIAETEKILDRVPSLQLMVDTAHLQSCGADPVQFIKLFGDRIIHTHIKDYNPDNHRFCELGLGCVDLKGCLDGLVEAGYQGVLCVERDAPPERTPEESSKISLEYLRPWLG
ncbi:MAG: sugar phosphate isomerase/epimerase family protein [Opitutales bacterium]